MEEISKWFLSEDEKSILVNELSSELPLLRTRADISQEELANLIGISRQTYGAIERKTKKMSWSTYLSLILFYDYNIKTHEMIRNMKAFPQNLITRFNSNEKYSEQNLNLLLQINDKNILESLDEQAISTVKTVLMIEYSRCNNISADAVVKFFEGVDFFAKRKIDEQAKVMKAVNSIKGRNLT